MPTHRRSRVRGFTLIEMVVTVAVIAIVASLVGVGIARQRPRATLASATTDVQGLIHSARQAALASGHDVIVMLFPVRASGLGPRFVVYEDAAFDFMAGGGAISFDVYNPELLASAGGQSRVLETLDLPAEIEVGPATGMGTAGPLSAPLDAIDVSRACSFCSEDASKNKRGAIRFDARGAATFYSADETKRPEGVGASFTITNPLLGPQRNTFVILTSTGAIQVAQNG